MKLTKTLTRFLRKNAGTLLAVAASVGVVATAIETGKATMTSRRPTTGWKSTIWHPCSTL